MYVYIYMYVCIYIYIYIYIYMKTKLLTPLLLKAHTEYYQRMRTVINCSEAYVLLYLNPCDIRRDQCFIV